MRENGFDWVQYSSIAVTGSSGNRRLKTDEYLEEGDFPVVDQGKALLAGYTNDETSLINAVPLVVFGDHTRNVKYIDFPFAVGADGVKLLRPKLNSWDPRYLAAVTQFAAEGLPNLGYSRHFRELSEALVPFTDDTHHQSRIAEILRTWDEAIEKTDRLIAGKSKAFEHWSLLLLSGRKRLGSKRSNWQSVALTDVATEATTRNGSSLGKEVVMGVNKSLGMIPMKDHVRASDLTRYKVVGPEAFAYNPMRLNIGSIAQNLHGHEVLVSPDYVAFSANPESLLPAYFDHLRRSWLWSRFVKTAGSGGVRVRIYYDDLADFVFELPPLPEQRRIVDVLDTGRSEIALLEAHRGALAKQKRGLMQKLLTGDWPVSVPTTKEAAE